MSESYHFEATPNADTAQMDAEPESAHTYRKTVGKVRCKYCGKSFPSRGIASHVKKHENKRKARKERDRKEMEAREKAEAQKEQRRSALLASMGSASVSLKRKGLCPVSCLWCF